MRARTMSVLMASALIGVLCACSPVGQTSSRATQPSGRTPTSTISGTLTRRADATPTPAPVATTVVPVVDEAVWGPCDDAWEGMDGSDDRFECATLPVPLDYEEPDGPTLDVALIRLPTTAGPSRIGSLIVNPGGPGASGVDWVRLGAIDSIPAELRARFDIVGFDPRGVGASSPVTCGQVSPLPDVAGLDPDSASDREAFVTQARRFADACAAESNDILPFVSTAAAARDLDLIRQAVGDDKLTYLGYSYGTYLGTAYAQQFGPNVRALVLDGAIDPTLDLVGRAEGSAVALEAALTDMMDACADNQHCPLHASIGDGFTIDAFLADLAQDPVPAAEVGAGRRLTDGDVRLAMLGLLRDRRNGWPVLEQGIAMAAEGDGSLLLAIADGVVGRGDVDVTGLAGNLAVNCIDLPQPDTDELFAAAERIRGAAPRFGPSYLMIFASCAVWPAPAVGQPAPATVRGAPPLLVVGTTGDAVTPFVWSRALAEQLNGRLLTREGSQHTAFGGDNVCTDRAVVPYLIELVLPPEGWSCG